MNTVFDLPNPHVPRTAEEYDDVVAEIDRLLDLDPAPFSADADRLELLSLLVENYDQEHHPIDDSGLSPQGVMDFMLEQKGRSRAELAAIMGGRSRASDFFSGKRDLSKA